MVNSHKAKYPKREHRLPLMTSIFGCL